MAINVGHMGQLAGKTATMAYRAGQSQYIDRRRQEEEQRQMELLKMQQQDRQFNQNLQNQAFQAGANRQQQAGMLLGGNALDIMRDQQRQQAATGLEQLSHQNLLERRRTGDASYRETLQFKQNLDVEQRRKEAVAAGGIPDFRFSETVPSGDGKHRVLNEQGLAVNQQLSKIRSDVQAAASGGAPTEELVEKYRQKYAELQQNQDTYYSKAANVPGEAYDDGIKRYMSNGPGKEPTDLGFTDDYTEQYLTPQALADNVLDYQDGRVGYAVLDPKSPQGYKYEVMDKLNVEQQAAEIAAKKATVMKTNSDAFAALLKSIPEPPPPGPLGEIREDPWASERNAVIRAQAAALEVDLGAQQDPATQQQTEQQREQQRAETAAVDLATQGLEGVQKEKAIKHVEALLAKPTETMTEIELKALAEYKLRLKSLKHGQSQFWAKWNPDVSQFSARQR